MIKTQTGQETDKRLHVKIILGILMAVVAFLVFSGPIMDIDFPFHVKTGEYIMQSGNIPSSDPFSIPPSESFAPTSRVKFILSQYWLAQVIMYIFYSLGGFPGVVVLRALVFALYVLLIYVSLLRKGPWAAFWAAALVVIAVLPSVLDRPQYFTFLFAVVLVTLLEHYRSNPGRRWLLFALPVIMLVWANIHGGFVFGIAVLLLYAVSETVKYFLQKPKLVGERLPDTALLALLATVFFAIFVSFVNPNHQEAMIITLLSHTSERWLFQSVREYESPLTEMASPYSLKIAIISFWILFGSVVGQLLLSPVRKKRGDLTVMMLTVFVLVAVLTAIRYIPLYLAVALPLAGRERIFNQSRFSEKLKKYFVLHVATGALCSAGLIWSVFLLPMKFSLNDNAYPRETADFLQSLELGGNLLNDANLGSYLLWRLSPRYRNFNDTRYLYFDRFQEELAVIDALSYAEEPRTIALSRALEKLVPPSLGKIEITSNNSASRKRKGVLWRELLDKYRIDFIVYPPCDGKYATIHPLMLELVADEAWALIRADGHCLVFARKSAEHAEIIRKYSKEKSSIFEMIEMSALPHVMRKSPYSMPYASLGLAWAMQGKDAAADSLADAALDLDGSNIVAHFVKSYVLLKKQKDLNNP